MLRMKNGDYVPKGSGLETVSGSEVVLQRVLLRLTGGRSPLWRASAAACGRWGS